MGGDGGFDVHRHRRIVRRDRTGGKPVAHYHRISRIGGQGRCGVIGRCVAGTFACYINAVLLPLVSRGIARRHT